MTKEAYWDSFLNEYPSERFSDLLRFPNRENALKGIYFKDDLTHDEQFPKSGKKKEVSPVTDPEMEKYIRNLDIFIRSQDKWYMEMEEKALREGITVDSAIRRDGIWLYKQEQKKESQQP
jgi:hypothetical protein